MSAPARVISVTSSGVKAYAIVGTSRLAHSGDTEFTQQMRPDELPVVAVLPLENLTGRRELDWTGAAVSTLVRDDPPE